MIKIGNNILTVKSFAKAVYCSNWNNDRAEYFPYFLITSFINGAVQQEIVNVPNHDSPSMPKDCVIVTDIEQERAYNAHIEAIKREEERTKLDIHKVVTVFKGRKVKIGTRGEIVGFYNSVYGKSVRLRLNDGQCVFTSINNVRVE